MSCDEVKLKVSRQTFFSGWYFGTSRAYFLTGGMRLTIILKPSSHSFSLPVAVEGLLDDSLITSISKVPVQAQYRAVHNIAPVGTRLVPPFDEPQSCHDEIDYNNAAQALESD